MRVLLIGSGGREHALAVALAQSPSVDHLVALPGNPGIAEVARCIAGDASDRSAVAALCLRERIDLAVVGPEQPLVGGLADTLRAHGIATFGPSAAAAQLEASKGFTKLLCEAHGIPTAAFIQAKSRSAARAALERFGVPVVVKADGLAAGKGVTVAHDRAEAEAAVDALFADGDGRVVVEEFLHGEEASLFVLCDGTSIRVLGSAQDHKRVGDGDTGPNTGGMGAYSPAPVLTPALEARALREIIEPTVAAMAQRGTPFVGMLYAGLMLTREGPKLIEYNVRFGDPEAQVLLPRLASDLGLLLHAVATGRLEEADLVLRPEHALTVVVAARGYPGRAATGGTIRGLDRVTALGAFAYQAGTVLDGDILRASGGRVLAVTALGEDLRAARDRAYWGVAAVEFSDGFHRTDIGWREIARLTDEA